MGDLEQYISDTPYTTSTAYELCDHELREVLRPKSVSEIVALCMRSLLQRSQASKICKNCGGFFPVYSYKSAEYCERLFGGTGKTCKEIGATRVYQEKLRKNLIVKLYNRAYKRYYAQVKYGKITILMTM